MRLPQQQLALVPVQLRCEPALACPIGGGVPPTKIVNTIAAHRPSIDIAELTELLDRTKELRTQAEKFQRKAAILMDVTEEMVKAPLQAAADHLVLGGLSDGHLCFSTGVGPLAMLG